MVNLRQKTTLSERFSLVLEDAALRHRVYDLFDMNTHCRKNSKDCIVVGGSAPLYSVFMNDCLVQEGLDQERAIGVLDSIFENYLRSLVDENTCTLHSSGVAINGKAIAFVGLSGSGKTTLALAMALDGALYMGDEYAYLNIEAGHYAHAKYPICIKRGTSEALGIEKWPVCTKMITPRDVEAEVISFDRICALLKTKGMQNGAAGELPLGAIVFPERAALRTETSLHHISMHDLPDLMMPSFECKGQRVAGFKKTISLVADQKIKLIKLRYHDAALAAKELHAYIKDQCDLSNYFVPNFTKTVGQCVLKEGYKPEWVNSEIAISCPNGNVFVLNKSAAIIFELLQNYREIDAAIEVFQRRFCSSDHVAKSSVLKTLHRLHDLGIIA